MYLMEDCIHHRVQYTNAVEEGVASFHPRQRDELGQSFVASGGEAEVYLGVLQTKQKSP